MKKITLILIVLFTQFAFSQVGVNTTTPDPSSMLDISATNKGVLVPRVSLNNVTTTMLDGTNTAATGLLIWNTNAGTVGGNGVGFYFFNGTQWIPITQTITGNTLDQSYDQGGAGVGKNINATDGAVRINGDDGFLVTGTFGTGNIINTEITGAGTRMFFNPRKAAFRAGNVFGNEWDDSNIGDFSIALGRSTTASNIYDIAIGIGSTASGSYSTALGWANTASGAYSISMGQNSTASGFQSTVLGYLSNATEDNSMVFGNNSIASGDNSFALGNYTTASGINSMAFGNNLTSESGYESVFGTFNTDYTPININGFNNADRLFVIGNGTNATNLSNALTIFKDGRMNINDAYTMPTSDGTNGQVMQTNGSGTVSWATPSTGTDDQNLVTPTLVGTTLNLNIENGTGTSIDLAPLQDGTGTDDQTIDNFSLSGTTLRLSLENDGLPLQTVNLSSLLGTDDQNLTTPTLTGTTLNLGIESGTGTSIDLAPLQDGTGTDDQIIDNFSLSGTTLRLSLENDGLPLQTVNLSSLQDGTGTDDQNLTTPTLVGTTLNLGIENGTGTSIDLAPLQDGTGTDDQTIDNFSLSGTTLRLSLENDGQPLQTVNLATLDTQNTLDQAYDEGGAGAGRIINASNGAVEIIGTNSNGSGLIVTQNSGSGGGITAGSFTANGLFPTVEPTAVKAIASGSNGEVIALDASIGNATGVVPPGGIRTNYGLKSIVTDSNLTNALTTNYGVFSYANGGDINWAGYFGNPAAIGASITGNVFVKDFLHVDRGLIYRPGGTATTVGHILQYVDTNGGLDAVNPSTLFIDTNTQNTLDQAYDQGGAGLGRTITADNGAVLINGNDGFQTTGTHNTGATLALTGAGTKMFFYPRKSAFRAGYVTGTQWDDANIGNYSIALGLSPIASNSFAVALGRDATATGASSVSLGWNGTASGGSSIAMNYLANASGDYSLSIGRESIASGEFATSIGYSANASNQNSVAIGNSTISSGIGSVAIGQSTSSSGFRSLATGYANNAFGDYSTSMGRNTSAFSAYETVIGLYSTIYTPNSTTAFDPADRLFVVGNGSSAIRSNALTIYKNGLMNINDEYNMPLVDGVSGQVMTTDGSGNVTFQNVPGDGTGTDDQNIQNLAFNSTTNVLTVGIENGTSQTVNLSALDTGGDITSVTAGTGLTGGGVTGAITLNAVGTNGLTTNADDIRLGGALIQATTITQGAFSMDINLNNTGDFAIQDNGTDVFFVEDTGEIGIGTNTPAYPLHMIENGVVNNAFFLHKTETSANNTSGIFIHKTGNGDGRSHAIFTDVDGSGIGQKYGVFNQISSTASGNQYGTRNYFSGASPSNQFGTFNNLDNAGTANHYGVYNGMRGTAASNLYATYNEFDNGTTATNLYGTYTNFSVNATGTGSKYGSYTSIDTSLGGTHYGTYNDVGVANGWAGYFLGNSYFSNRVGIGTTTPDYNLSVSGTLNLREDIATGGAALRVNGSEAIWFDGNQFSWGFGGTVNFFSDDVGIGINAPAYKLDVRENLNIGYVAQIYNTSTNVDADGLRIQLNATTPGATNAFIGFLNGAGTIRGQIVGSATGVNYNTTSDRRLKTNINDIDNALNLIDKIQPRIYEYKSNLGTEEYGFIAQELQPLYPQAVSGTPDSDVETDPMMVDYSRLTPLLTAGIKELKEKVDHLTIENQKLKDQISKIETLETENAALKTALEKINALEAKLDQMNIK